MTRKIYVATSWRNSLQPSIVVALRADGHAVFDFREANGSFRWPPIATAQDYMDSLATHGPAIAALERDRDALNWCDTCVLVLPAGHSAHVEIGFAAGTGKDVIILLDPTEPNARHELMYLLGRAANGTRFVTSTSELVAALRNTNSNSFRNLGEALAREEMEKAHRLIEAGYSDLVDQVLDGEIDIDTAAQIFDGRRS